MSILNDIVIYIAKNLDEKYTQAEAETIVSNYFIRIDAPDNLMYIDHVANEMQQIIKILIPTSEDKDIKSLQDWILINNIIRDNYYLLKNMGVELLVNTKGKPSIHKIKTIHPLYSVLWHVNEVESNSFRYIIFKSVMFRIWNNLVKKTTHDFGYQSSLIWRLMGMEISKPTLNYFPEVPQSLDDYVKSLQSLLDVEENII